MNDMPSNKNKQPITAEQRARLIERLNPNSNVIFVDFKRKNA